MLLVLSILSSKVERKGSCAHCNQSLHMGLHHLLVDAVHAAKQSGAAPKLVSVVTGKMGTRVIDCFTG